MGYQRFFCRQIKVQGVFQEYTHVLLYGFCVLLGPDYPNQEVVRITDIYDPAIGFIHRVATFQAHHLVTGLLHFLLGNHFLLIRQSVPLIFAVFPLFEILKVP